MQFKPCQFQSRLRFTQCLRNFQVGIGRYLLTYYQTQLVIQLRFLGIDFNQLLGRFQNFHLNRFQCTFISTTGCYQFLDFCFFALQLTDIVSYFHFLLQQQYIKIQNIDLIFQRMQLDFHFCFLGSQLCFFQRFLRLDESAIVNQLTGCKSSFVLIFMGASMLIFKRVRKWVKA